MVYVEGTIIHFLQKDNYSFYISLIFISGPEVGTLRLLQVACTEDGEFVGEPKPIWSKTGQQSDEWLHVEDFPASGNSTFYAVSYLNTTFHFECLYMPLHLSHVFTLFYPTNYSHFKNCL